MMTVFIDGIAPKKQHPDDAAFDLAATFNDDFGHWPLEPLERALIPCGFAIAIPRGHVGLVCPRSGLAANTGLTVLNAPGVIDPGYRGDIGVILINLSNRRTSVKAGDRIAQLLIVPAPSFTLAQSKNYLAIPTERGGDGFGSTGMS